MEGTLEEPQTEECRRTAPVAEQDTEPSLGSLLVPERLAVWVWVLGYTALLSSLSILRYGLWIARGDDLGVFEQGLWLLLHHGLHAISTYTGQPIMADGASSFLLLLAPVYAIGGVGCLLVLQSLSFGIGYYFIRRLGRAVGVNPALAHILGVIYLVYPTVLAVNLYDFHPQVVGVPLIFGVACALVERRWFAYVFLICATALVGGAAAVALVGLGVALVLEHRSAWGAAAVVVGLTAGLFDVHVLIPWLTHATGSGWLAIFGSVASSAGLRLGAWVHHPEVLWIWVRRLRSWEYLAWLIGPFVGVALTGRLRLVSGWWLPALLLIEMNLMSGIPSVVSPFTEYSAMAVPFLFSAAVMACREWPRQMATRSRLIWLAPVAALLVVFGAQQFRSYWRHAPSNTSALAAMAAAVPNAAPVMAQDFVLPHVANRPDEWQLATLGSFTLPAGTYLIVDTATTPTLTSPATLARARVLLTDTKQTSVVFSDAGVIVGKVLRSIPPSG